MQRLLSLALVLSLALAGCGDDEPAPFGAPNGDNPFGGPGATNPFGNMPGGIDPSDPESAEKFAEKFLENAANFELDEATLEKLYDFEKRMRSIDSKKDPMARVRLAQEMGAGGLNYGLGMTKLQGARTALRRGAEKTRKNYEQAKARLADAEKRLTEASDQEKPMLETQVKMTNSMLKSMESMVREAEKLEDPAYKAMIEKWIKKFDELDDRK